MPIKAAADKLIREMEMFGEDFEKYGQPEDETVRRQIPSRFTPEAHTLRSQVTATEEPGNATALATTSTTTSSSDPARAKKGKLAAKNTGLHYQFQIMESIGECGSSPSAQ